MEKWMLKAEAEECRLLADASANGPEKGLLLSLASAFDDLRVPGSTATPAPVLREAVSARYAA
jgi:hypothetical protein